MQDLPSAAVILQRARERLRREGGAKHSPLWWWLYDHFAAVEEGLARRELTFVALAKELATDGIHNRHGRPADRNLLRKTLLSVRQAKARPTRLGACAVLAHQ